MKAKACDKYRDTIERYSCGELNAADSERLLEHIQQCAGCKDYLDTLKEQEAKMTQWAHSLEPLMEAGQAQAIERLHLTPEPVVRKAGLQPVWRRYVGYAAAACVLIVAGFLAGQGMRPTMDMDALAQQWAASVQPQLEANITASVVETLRPEIVGEYAAMQDALSDQINSQLTAYAEQTVLRNDYQTYRLLTELIKSIQAAQVQNQQWALSAMQELEEQRLLDQQQMRSELATFAVYTDDQLQRTQQKLQELETRQ